jgi:hypothetical protein
MVKSPKLFIKGNIINIVSHNGRNKDQTDFQQLLLQASTAKLQQ